MSYFPPVTAHAILRYLTRIEDFDLRPLVKQLGRDAGNWPLARAAADRFGVPVIELQKRICPEHLAPAVRGGAARIRREGLVLICSGGLVVSIQEDIHHSACKVRSKREIKAEQQRSDRRRR